MHPLVFSFASGTVLFKKYQVQILRSQNNHNHLLPVVAGEITNNIYGNHIGANLADKLHEQEIGGNLNAMLTYNSKVRQDITMCLP